jgi:hypothetical protein
VRPNQGALGAWTFTWCAVRARLPENRVAASEVDNEGPRLVGHDRLASRPRAVIERRHEAE